MKRLDVKVFQSSNEEQAPHAYRYDSLARTTPRAHSQDMKRPFHEPLSLFVSYQSNCRNGGVQELFISDSVAS